MEYINLFDLQKWADAEGGLELINKLMEFKILPATRFCPSGHEMVLVRDISKQDNFKYICRKKKEQNKKKTSVCGYSCNLRQDTFFYKSHLSLLQIIGFVNLWTQNVQLTVIERQLRIAEPTAVDWSSFCREVVFDALVIKRKKIGGVGKIVEIDESKFGKRKYHRGHRVEGQWVFGAVERGSGECFLAPVAQRDSLTLIQIIKENVLPGTTIISDCWKAYDQLGAEGYEHLRVNHSINLKDPESGAHTNTIESTWRHIKSTLPQYNRRKEFFGGYLAKYLFLRRCSHQGLDPTKEFLLYAGELYKPGNEGVYYAEDEEENVDSDEEIEEN